MPFEIDLRCSSTVSTRTTNTQALTAGSPPRYSEPKQRPSPPACIVRADTIPVKDAQDSQIKFWAEISLGNMNGNIDIDSARGLLTFTAYQQGVQSSQTKLALTFLRSWICVKYCLAAALHSAVLEPGPAQTSGFQLTRG